MKPDIDDMLIKEPCNRKLPLGIEFSNPFVMHSYNS